MYFPAIKFENLSHKTNSTTLSLGKLGSTDTKKEGEKTETTGISWCWLRLFCCCANFLYWNETTIRFSSPGSHCD